MTNAGEPRHANGSLRYSAFLSGCFAIRQGALLSYHTSKGSGMAAPMPTVFFG